MQWTVLLVEDEPGHIELIRRSFEQSPYNIQLLMARSLREAREYLQDTVPDIIFVDFLLPDGRGTELINADDPGYPVVMLTSHGSEQIAVEALKAGALDYVVKSDTIFLEMPRLTERLLREWRHIEERKRAEAELRQSEEKFRKMLEASSEGILLVDVDGSIVMYNDYAEQIFGFSREEIMGQPIERLVPMDYRGRHAQWFQEFFAEPDSRLMAHGREVHACRKDGEMIPVEVRLSPITIANTRLAMCFVADVSERKLLEEQRLYARTLEVELEKEREIIELKDRFTSIVSHEFRTPLAVIQTTTDLISRYYDKLPPDKMREYINKISQQVQQMVSLLEDVLLIGKANAQRLEIQPVPLDICSYCESLVENTRLTDNKAHELIYEHQPLPVVYIDKRILEHIMTNMLSNAIKYSPPGSQVRVRIYTDDEDIVIEIADQGIGIPEDERERIYEAFHRAANARDVSGTGLGLAIVKHNVELHGGTVDFVSRVGQGTAFTVRLPFRPVDRTQAPSRQPGGDNERSGSSP